jgi:hypothetical protein
MLIKNIHSANFFNISKRNHLFGYEIILSAILFVIPGFVTNSFSQCSCIGGAAVGSASLIGGTSNIGVLKEGNIRVIGTLVHSNGNDFYRGDIPTSPLSDMLVRGYNSTFTGLIIGYGITNNFTIDIETGYFADKMQDYGDYKISGSGFSFSTVFLKFNLLNQRKNIIEWSMGLGGKLPLASRQQNLPQNIKSSNGAFGGVLLSFLRKGLGVWNILLINRYDWSDINNGLFQTGESFINSVFVTNSISDDITGVMEFRSDVKLVDRLFGEDLTNTGWNVFILSPQLNYSIGDWIITAFYDYPVYKYYNETQLTNKQNLGLALTWNSNLF